MKHQEDNNLITLLRDLLAKGQVEEVLEILREEYGKDEIVLQLSENHSRIKKEEMLSVVPGVELNQRKNQLTYSLIKYLEQLKPENRHRIITPSSKEEKEEDDLSIWNWIFQNLNIGKFTIILIAGLSGIWVLGALGAGCITITGDISDNAVEEKPNSIFNWFIWISYVVHLFICIYAFIVIPKIRPAANFLSSIDIIRSTAGKSEINTHIDKANEVMFDFLKCWRWAWAGWFFLYTVLIFSKIKSENPYQLVEFFKSCISPKYYGAVNPAIDFAKNLFRDVSTLAIGGCFSILYFTKSENTNRHWKNRFTIILFYILLIVFLIQLYSYSIHYFIDNETIKSYFQAITLLIFSVCLSLFVSRLEGRLINTPIIFPVLFYVYAGTQISNAFIKENIFPNFVAFTYSYSLFAKALMFLFVMWLIESGKMSLYIIRLRSIIEKFEE